MRVAVLGCSFVAGLNPTENWVYELSKLHPNIEFYNLGVAGTGITYHTYLLEQILDRVDYTIFKFTTPRRFTWWEDHNIIESIEKITDNYYTITKRLPVDKINVGSIASKTFLKSDPSKHRFGVEYLKRLNKSLYDLDYKVYVEYIKNKVDFYYWHLDEMHNVIKDRCINLELKDFDNLVIDNGFHLNNQGNKLEAEWINNKWQI